MTSVEGGLTQLGDAAHPGGEQRLFQRAELSLGVSLALAAPPRALLVPVQVQTVGEAQGACRQHREEPEVRKQARTNPLWPRNAGGKRMSGHAFV